MALLKKMALEGRLGGRRKRQDCLIFVNIYSVTECSSVD